MTLEVGRIVEGVVTGITNFGAFILLPDGETGLVHISEVADSYVKDINDYLQKKDTVKVKILSIGDDGKIALSIRKAKPGHERAAPKKAVPKVSFEDRLNKFLKESDEKQLDIRRNTDSKRGGKGSARG